MRVLGRGFEPVMAAMVVEGFRGTKAVIADLPSAILATDAEVFAFIDRYALFGRGIGYVDVHLLAAARLTAGASLWTNDKRLKGVGETLGLAAPSPRGSIGMPTEGAGRLAWRGLNEGES